MNQTFNPSNLAKKKSIPMNAKLLVLFSQIQIELTHQIAIEILQTKTVNESELSKKFNTNIFLIRRSILELVKLGLLKKLATGYKLNQNIV